MFIRKGGEKSSQLSKCGELLFGCTGKLLTTQGIYVPNCFSSTLKPFICKRTVWAPDSLSHECLAQHLETFGATLPFSVQKVASLHRFGICGINPTRTVHAEDKSFLLLARIPHKQFAVYGIVEMGHTQLNNLMYIESITTNIDDILVCVDWIKNEIGHHKIKQSKNKRIIPHVLTYEASDKDSESLERKSEPQKLFEETEQNHTQLKSTETESELTVSTPELINQTSGECVNPQNVSFHGVYMPNQNTIIWFPVPPSQGATEPSEGPNTFFVPS